MERRSSALFALLVAGAFVWLALAERNTHQEAEAARAATETEERNAAFSRAQEASLADVTEASPGTPEPALPSPPPNTLNPGRFTRLPDGSPLPPLPNSAPQKLKLGVALFRYQGTEGPPGVVRSREEALALARTAQETGSKDFAKAVAMGDRGSDENVGWMTRGVLEPAVEYSVFSLQLGEVAKEPIDTPRGFWVVKRLR